jgi:hypothetical protein
MDFVTNSWVDGTSNGMGRGEGESGVEGAGGGGSVANGTFT